MCGITGIWHFDQNQAISLPLIAQMTSTLRHRGPDDEGYLLGNIQTRQLTMCGGADTNPELRLPAIDAYNGHSFTLAFGFRRLAILDLSPAGHQPMASTDGSCYIIFNGEIYNYLELRAELARYGYEFRTGTDTEVILAAYQQWGVDCLSHFNGMWAFALWDNRRQSLFCARDRFGIKPFYYFFNGTTFAFASEIKALLQMPDLERQPNDPVIYDYLTYGYVDHTDETFFAGIKQLPAAHYLVVDPNKQFEIHRYWDLDPSKKAEAVNNEKLYREEFYALFEDAIRVHLRSDVPIGTCLSGGLDSSSIVCVANKLLFADRTVNPELVGRQQKTFSSCSTDKRFDEREYIEHVLKATNAEANYVFPKPQELLEDLSRLMWHQDEPFVSTSMYAQWRVMETAAGRGVKVLLDGQGGDEILAGYQLHNYYWASLLQQGRLAELWAEMLAYRHIYGASFIGMTTSMMVPSVPACIKKYIRLRRGLGLDPAFARQYRQRLPEVPRHYQDHLHNRLYILLMHYLLPSLLRYEDRNSMAFSIEARVPFLDYRLVEYIFSLPLSQKVKAGYSKTVLRGALQGILPEAIQKRTSKLGFSTPEREWLSTELNAWVKDILDSNACRMRGYLDSCQTSKALEAHVAGQRDLTSIAWRWVNLEMWFRVMIDQQSG